MLIRLLILAACVSVPAAAAAYFLLQEMAGDNSGTMVLTRIVPLIFFTSLLSGWLGSLRTGSSDPSIVTDTEESRESGTVKWFNASKGFGFITRDSGEDVFVHFRSIRGSGHRVLHDGQRVDFLVSESEKGLQAEDVAEAS